MNTNYKETFKNVNLISLISFARSESEYSIYNGGCYPSITVSLANIADDDSRAIYIFFSNELERLIKKYGFEKVDFLETWTESVDFMTSEVLAELESGNREDVFFYLSK